MKIFSYGKDGGKNSTVSGFWFVEIKSLFSIVLLKFDKGSRVNYHSHAFNAYTWFLKGLLIERIYANGVERFDHMYRRSLVPKFTPKNNVHKVIAKEVSWAISIRGPWDKTWFEINPETKEKITLTNGRKIVKVNNE